ncbi:calcium-binding protein, partial [Cognatishimia sp. F0-27]|uniref:calcium-binding protein n=1 Tax=Cognatishimia sp. F0-27 TaxID=2816855 RepID=UPI001D8A6681
MANFFITSFSSTSQALVGFETGIVAQGATLGVTSTASAVSMNGAFSSLFIEGAVISRGIGASVVGSPEVEINVGGNGSILGGSSGINFSLGSGGVFKLNNAGTISGNTNGVTWSSISNAPSIGVQVVNTGEILGATSRAFNAYVTDNSTLVNTGTIAGRTGIQWAGDSSLRTVTTINDGVISAQNDGVQFNVNAAFESADTGQVDILRNTGTINGDVYLNEEDDTLSNSGLIEADYVDMGDGNDLYDGRLGAVSGQVLGGHDNDTILGGAAGEDLNGGLEDDLIEGNGGDDLVDGDQGNDTLEGGRGEDTLFGRSGNDRLEGGQDNDSLLGGSGDDRLKGDLGDDYLDGSFNTDTVIYSGVFASVFIDLENGVATGGGGTDQLVAIENAFGSAFA